MRLSIRHRTVYEYDPAALRLALRLRLWPSVYEGQALPDWTVTVNGEPVKPLLTDDFGDVVALWHAHQPIGSVEIIAQGVVETSDTAGVVRGLGHARAAGVFLRETELTRPDDAICELAATVAAEKGDDGTLAVMHALCNAVREAVDYRPGVTDADTTASRALALVNLLKTMIGAGLLTLPYATSQVGLILSFFGLAVLVSQRPDLPRAAVRGILFVGCVAVLVLGIVTAVSGEREFHHKGGGGHATETHAGDGH